MIELSRSPWIISDTHFFHDNMVKYENRPVDHTERMVENWRRVVQPDDIVLHLGDVLMGHRSLWPTLAPLPGKVYVLDSGNHDEPHKRAFLEAWGWRFVPEFEMIPNRVMSLARVVSFTHKPVNTVEENDTDNTIVALVAPLPKGNINIHGHIHGQAAPSPQHINACVEHFNYSPVRLADLLADVGAP